MIVLQGAREQIDHLRFSPDGRTLVAPCSGGLQVWIGPSLANPQTRIIRSSNVTSVLFTPGGNQVLIGGAESAVVEFATGEVTLEFPPRSGCFGLSPDGQFL